MSRLRVESFTVSLDGFGAGPDQDLNNPLGVGGTSLHGWALSTRTFQKQLFGSDGGEGGIDDDFAARGFHNIGAWILGRNMFGPIRGPWPDESWRGWWGEDPVYHGPVFVLTNHARPPLVMGGGTTFYFVTEGAAVALERAREAAEGKDVRLDAVIECTRRRTLRSTCRSPAGCAVCCSQASSNDGRHRPLRGTARGQLCCTRARRGGS